MSKEPNPHDPELVNREDVFQRIAVRNWGAFQKEFKTKGRPYVMDACGKDSDPDYAPLTMIQRYVLAGTRRQIGLHGQNVANSSELLGRALAIRGQERHNVLAAMRELTRRGFYLLTNEVDPFSKELNKQINNKSESTPVFDSLNTTSNSKSNTPFVLTSYAESLGGFPADEVQRAIAYMLEHTAGFRSPKLTSEKKLEKHIGTLVAQAGTWKPLRKPVGRTWDRSCANCSGTGYENKAGWWCECIHFYRTYEHKEEITLDEWENLMRHSGRRETIRRDTLGLSDRHITRIPDE
jgi:hypothetical protein